MITLIIELFISLKHYLFLYVVSCEKVEVGSIIMQTLKTITQIQMFSLNAIF